MVGWGDIPTMRVTIIPINMKTPILRYHIPARVESGHKGCIVKATAPMTAKDGEGEGEGGEVCVYVCVCVCTSKCVCVEKRE